MIIHFIHHPVSAKRFVEPLVKALNCNGIKAELWVEPRAELKHFTSAIDCPKRFEWFDLSVNPLKVLLIIVKLRNKLRKFKPEAIHAHQSRGAFIPLIASRLAKVPIRIYHNHGVPYLGYNGILRGLLWCIEFFNCNFATHVITVSKSISEKMVSDRIVSQSKCQVLGEGSACGIDLEEFAPEYFNANNEETRKRLGIPQENYVVFYVGRPVKRKGFHVLLNAWESINHNTEQVLLLAGCSSKDIEKFLGHKLSNSIALGYVNDLRPYYMVSDVIVLPSAHEGLPYSMLEGAAAGKALIGSDVPGIDSIIINNKNGLLVTPGSSDALAQALVALKDNRDLKERMGHSGRQYVERYFDRNAFNGFLLDYYDRIGIKTHSA